MALDNSEHVIRFVPDEDDGDTFIYTEMLDRGKRKGNNSHRLVKTFYHRSKAEFREQFPVIKELCDLAGVRACTRLAPRSYRKVGREFTRLVVDTAMSENWAGMKSLYNRACGIVRPERKLWLLDVDYPDAKSEAYRAELEAWAVLVAVIPSKKGLHYITHPFHLDSEMVSLIPANISVHKDNPTNLYIPDNAE